MTHATIYKRHERPGGGIPLWEIVTVDMDTVPYAGLHGTKGDLVVVDDPWELGTKEPTAALARWFAAKLKGPDHDG